MTERPSAAQLLYQVIGSPRDEESVDLAPPVPRCRFCGGGPVLRGLKWSAWGGAVSTVPDRTGDADSWHVCDACVYLAGRTNPVPGRPPKEGKAAGGNFRNYSHCVHFPASGPPDYANFSKGEKPGLLAWLRAPKTGRWFAFVALSGQKHGVNWCHVNYPNTRGIIRFEEQVVHLPDAAGWVMIDDMVALLTAGATKEGVETGAYSVGSYTLCADEIETFEEKWGRRLRGTPLFALFVFLAQRDEEAVQARMEAERAALEARKAREREAAKAQKTKKAAPAPGVDELSEKKAKPTKKEKTTDGVQQRAKKGVSGRVDERPVPAAEAVLLGAPDGGAEVSGPTAVAPADERPAVGERGRVGNEAGARDATQRSKQLSLF